jgi:hypothetical protein
MTLVWQFPNAHRWENSWNWLCKWTLLVASARFSLSELHMDCGIRPGNLAASVVMRDTGQ